MIDYIYMCVCMFSLSALDILNYIYYILWVFRMPNNCPDISGRPGPQAWLSNDDAFSFGFHPGSVLGSRATRLQFVSQIPLCTFRGQDVAERDSCPSWTIVGISDLYDGQCWMQINHMTSASYRSCNTKYPIVFQPHFRPAGWHGLAIAVPNRAWW